MLEIRYRPDFSMMMRRNKEQLKLIAANAKINVEGMTKIKMAEVLAVHKFESDCATYRKIMES
jgi:hypothetical protein